MAEQFLKGRHASASFQPPTCERMAQLVRVKSIDAGELPNPQHTGSSLICGRFFDFVSDNHKVMIAAGFSDHDIASLSVAELLRQMRQWVKRQQRASGSATT